MKHEQHTFADLPTQPFIDTDLPPIYQLTELQYQSIINRMTNLLGEMAQRLAQTGNTELALIATEQGYEILRDYDDDVAEAIRWCTQPRRTDHTHLGQARDIAPKEVLTK